MVNFRKSMLGLVMDSDVFHDDVHVMQKLTAFTSALPFSRLRMFSDNSKSSLMKFRRAFLRSNPFLPIKYFSTLMSQHISRILMGQRSKKKYGRKQSIPLRR